MGGRDVEGLLGTVARRSDVLRALEGGVLSKPELEERVRVSRSTIDRAVRELETGGLVRRADEGFVATTTGRLAVEQYRRLRGSLDSIEDATRLLEHVPFADAPPPAALVDAEFRWPEPPEPARILEPIVDILRRSDTFRGATRAVSDPKLLSDVGHLILERGIDTEFVYSERMIEHLRSEYTERMATLRPREHVRMFITDTLPFSLGVTHSEEISPRLVVIAYSDDGELRGVLYNDTPAAVAWGEDAFRQYRRQATEL